MAKARKEHPKPKNKKSIKKTTRRIQKNNEMLERIWKEIRK